MLTKTSHVLIQNKTIYKLLVNIRLNLIINMLKSAILAIIIFLAHPYGRQVPLYTLFWVIPLVAFRFRSNLFMKSLGATFTAHSVGGAAWIWAFNLKASIWQGLIPVVISERLLFAAGIAGSFILTKAVLNLLATYHVLPKPEISQG